MKAALAVTLALLGAALRVGAADDFGAAVARGDLPAAEAVLRDYQQVHGATPEMVEAMSWLARVALDTKRYAQADEYAAKTLALCAEEMKRRPLDAETHLPLALGAAIEVKAQTMAARGERTAALAYLHREALIYGASSIGPRIQKNVNMIGMTGRPAPELVETQYLGPKPQTLLSLRGKPVLLYFWAHWCADCRAEVPLLEKIRSEYAFKGLTLCGPTRLYGYTAAKETAAPAEELKYIETVRERFYAPLVDVPAPLSTANFLRYGASTTPTIVLIDRKGIVRLYHPGAMTEAELRAALAGVL